ncbi:unnamed protein product [Diamesa serratosioi]
MDYVETVKKYSTPSSYDDGGSVVMVMSDINNSIRNFSSVTINDDIVYFLTSGNFSYDNLSSILNNSEHSNSNTGSRDPLSVILPISLCYFVIFVAGILGNVITCLVIAKNKTMHTATNYYLFNLAVSDLLVLMFGMPPDFYNIWFPAAYPFSEMVCILQGMFSETSTNATVLTITSFTFERWLAICKPFTSHKMSKLSRVVKFIFAIWILAFSLAAPQAFQFGLVLYKDGGVSCTVKNQFVEHAFEVSSFLFFLVPMTIICVLYILIGIKLRKSKLLYGKKTKSSDSHRQISGQTRVIRMLSEFAIIFTNIIHNIYNSMVYFTVAVVVTFFLCWAPFHAQRIMAIYGKIMQKSIMTNELFLNVYAVLTYISGILYFLSTCINPFLYNIMSHKFRNASKLTLFVHCFNTTSSNKPKMKSQIITNYSALTLRFGGNNNLATINRSHILAPHIKNESLEIRDIIESENGKNFANKLDTQQLSPYNATPITSYPQQTSRYQDPTTSSYSPVTSSTFMSKDNNLNMKNNKLYFTNKKTPLPQSENKLNTIAEKLRKCTKKVLIFKTESPTVNEMINEHVVTNDNTITKKLSNDTSIISANTISNSSLQEIDEEEFTSSELAQMMDVVNREITHMPHLKS